MGALDAIAPGTPAVLAAHMNAFRDPDPAVRAAGASFQMVPADESLVSVLVTALGDPNEGMHVKVVTSLSEVLFESSAVAPAPIRALRDEAQRKAVLEALGNHLETTTVLADSSRVRVNALSASIPALTEAVAMKDEQIKLVVYRVLGREVSFSRLNSDEQLRKAIEPALSLYLQGLDESDPAIREEVLGHLGAIPIRRPDIVSSIQRFLERSDCSENEKQRADLALKELANPPGSGGGNGPRGPQGRGCADGNERGQGRCLCCTGRPASVVRRRPHMVSSAEKRGRSDRKLASAKKPRGATTDSVVTDKLADERLAAGRQRVTGHLDIEEHQT